MYLNVILYIKGLNVILYIKGLNVILYIKGLNVILYIKGLNVILYIKGLCVCVRLPDKSLKEAVSRNNEPEPPDDHRWDGSKKWIIGLFWVNFPQCLVQIWKNSVQVKWSRI